MDAPLRERITRLLLDRRDPRVLIGITTVTIAALIAGAVMAYAVQPRRPAHDPPAQVATRSTATPPPPVPTGTPFAPASFEPAPSPSISTPVATSTPTADPSPVPMPTEPTETETYPTPAPHPHLDLQVGDDPSDLPGVAGYRIEDGDSVAVTLHLTTQDLDRSKCRVTQTFEPDHPDAVGRSISLPAVAEQELTLADGSHTFAARCPSVIGTLDASVRVIAMDGRPEACEGFQFVRDDVTASSYEELTEGILGTWRGCVSTPWTPMYEVTFTFNADGTYSATANEELDGVRMTALYYGLDEDSPLKRYAITDFQASQLGIGEIDIDFGTGTVRDSLRNIRLMGDDLEFEMFHVNRYGPLTFQLSRIVGP